MREQLCGLIFNLPIRKSLLLFLLLPLLFNLDSSNVSSAFLLTTTQPFGGGGCRRRCRRHDDVNHRLPLPFDTGVRTTTTTTSYSLTSRRRQQQHRILSFRSTSTSSTSLHMTLIRLNVEELEQLISVNGKPTPQQYQSYFGRTDRERYSRLVEAGVVALLGSTCSYFLSFVMGGFVATILGTLSILWGILSPELKAYQRNWEFLGGRPILDEYDNDYEYDKNTNGGGGLYGALWMGQIADVCVVEEATSVADEYDLNEFLDYTMETDELDKYTGQPYLLRLLLREKVLNDKTTTIIPRELQIHARLSEEYIQPIPLRRGLAACVLLLSTDPDFETLAALSDVYVLPPPAPVNNNNAEQQAPAVLVGDYPYLNRAGMEELLATENDVWDALVAQEDDEQDVPFVNDNEYYDSIENDMDDNNYYYNDNANDDYYDYNDYYYEDDDGYDGDGDKVPIRRGRRQQRQ